MGFQKRWDVTDLKHQIGKLLVEIHSPYNDGFTAMSCKHDLYQLKCFINDAYETLPKFSGEEDWEQERIVQKLKQK